MDLPVTLLVVTFLMWIKGCAKACMEAPGMVVAATRLHLTSMRSEENASVCQAAQSSKPWVCRSLLGTGQTATAAWEHLLTGMPGSGIHGWPYI
jgi:hypothetical protein